MRSEDFFELRRLAQADAKRRMADKQFELAGCIGKDAYQSFTHAQKVLNRMRERKQRVAMQGAHIYHCRHCGLWHLGAKR